MGLDFGVHICDRGKVKGHIKFLSKKVWEDDSCWKVEVDEDNLVYNVGLGEIRNFVAGESASYPTHFAIGSGTTAVTATDTYLEEEVWRNAFTDTDISVASKVTFGVFFSSTQGNGDNTISNAALFTTAQTLLEDGETVSDWADTNDATSSADTTVYQNGSKSMKIALVNAAGNGEVTKTTAIGDLSSITGASSGTPTEGRVRLLVYCDAVANLNGTNAIQYKIGSDSSNYSLFSLDDSELTDDTWYVWDIDLSAGSETGTPDWTAVSYQQIIVNETGDVNVYIDDIQTFGPKIYNGQTFTGFTKDKNTELLGYWTLEFLDN